MRMMTNDVRSRLLFMFYDWMCCVFQKTLTRPARRLASQRSCRFTGAAQIWLRDTHLFSWSKGTWRPTVICCITSKPCIDICRRSYCLEGMRWVNYSVVTLHCSCLNAGATQWSVCRLFKTVQKKFMMDICVATNCWKQLCNWKRK